MIPLKKNCVYKIVMKNENGWWLAEADGKQGYVPKNFIEVVPSSGHSHSGHRSSTSLGSDCSLSRSRDQSHSSSGSTNTSSCRACCSSPARTKAQSQDCRWCATADIQRASQPQTCSLHPKSSSTQKPPAPPAAAAAPVVAAASPPQVATPQNLLLWLQLLPAFLQKLPDCTQQLSFTRHLPSGQICIQV